MTQQESSITTTLYLVRHGETDLNRERIVQGRGVNPPLNALGRQQAALLGAHAKDWNLDVIYTSTLRRAGETAHIIAKACPEIPVLSLESLEEMSWGVYEGKAMSPERREAFTKMRDAWQAGNYAYKVEGGESALDVQARAIESRDAIMAQHQGARILVVSHGRFLRLLLATLLPEYGLERMEELKHANTCVNHLTHDGTRYTAVTLNDTTHLAPLQDSQPS